MIVQIVLYVVIAALATVAFRARARGRIRMGLGPRAGAAGDALVGAAITGVAMLGVFAAGSLLGIVRVERVGFDVLVLLLALVIYVVLGAVEEMLYRVFALNGLLALSGHRWIAVAGSAVLFGAGHASNPRAAVVHQAPADGPVWLTGGAYGPEGGVVGIGARLVVIAAVLVPAPRRRRAAGLVDTPSVAR